MNSLKIAFISLITICVGAAFPAIAQTQSKPNSFKSYVSPQEPLQRNEKRMTVQRGNVHQQQRAKREEERISRTQATSTPKGSSGPVNPTNKSSEHDLNDNSINKQTSATTPDVPSAPAPQNNATNTYMSPQLPGTTLQLPNASSTNQSPSSPFAPQKKTPFVNSLKEYQDAQSTTEQK